MNFFDFQISKLQQTGAILLSPGSILSLPQIAVAFAIAVTFLAVRQRRRRGGIRPMALLRALRPRPILFHASTRADLLYYVINTFAASTLIGWGIVSSATIADVTVHLLRAGFGIPAPVGAPEWALRIGVTLTAFLGYEFGYYVDHYLKHKIPFLWAFHKVHHTAEVLTPLTVFRVHPIDTLIFANILALTIGTAQGLFIYAAGKPVDLYLIDNANVITVVFLFLLAQLQHSQFWIPLRGLAGRLLLSPAHHQIHHSIDPAHYNQNLGSFLAVFDWAFGTLAIPEKTSPRLTFGVADAKDPHRIGSLLLDPFAGALASVGFVPRSRATEPGSAPAAQKDQPQDMLPQI
ncbi:MAG: sterol desaturase family protein [Methylovirgula sp.]